MVTKQFQYEPALGAAFPGAEGSHTARFHSETKSRFDRIQTPAREPGLAALPSMMLGLMLRGWLTGSEKMFLDRMAPHKSITFLIRGNHYLHPEDVPLFPYELIETAVRQKTTAVFTHLFCPTTSRDTHRYKIMTAVIDPDANAPIVFGLFGPEPVISEPEIENRFMSTTDRFRQAHRAAKGMLDKLTDATRDDQPLLLINRASGRLLYLNRPALQQCEAEEQQLVDAEFSQVKKSLSGLILDKRLQIRNITDNDLNLSVVTVEGGPRPDGDSVHLARFLLEKLREQVDGDAAADLSAEAVTEAVRNHDLLRRIDELQWLLQPGRPSDHRVNLLYELDQAVKNTTSRTDREYPVCLVKRASELYCTAEADSHRNLFEAVLSAHSAGTPLARSSTITVDEEADSRTITVRFATFLRAADDSVSFDGGWDEFATDLAHMLGVGISHRREEPERKLITEITIETSTGE